MQALRNSYTAKLGFTMAEVMVAMGISSVVITGSAITFAMGIRSYRQAVAETDASNRTNIALLRTAYGLNGNCGLRAAFTPITALSNSDGWSITFNAPSTTSDEIQINHMRYNKSTQTIELQSGENSSWNIIGRHIIASTIATSSTCIQIMVRSQSVVGNKKTENQKTSVIAFRN
jgi:prepilin-type N-terminal cleavage/methylation domain-containing protein